MGAVYFYYTIMAHKFFFAQYFQHFCFLQNNANISLHEEFTVKAKRFQNDTNIVCQMFIWYNEVQL